MYTLYVLKLEKGKYYVGITTKTPEARFREHTQQIRAAKWTMRYKPLKIIDTKPLPGRSRTEAELYEAKVTRKYMQAHGKNNVRGGDLTDLGEYTFRFGRVFDALSWDALTTLILSWLIILYLLLKLGKFI